MPHDQLIKLSSMLALAGVGMLTLTATFGGLLVSQTTQKINLTKGQTFKYHRLMAILGAVLVLLHPVPLGFAHTTTGISVASIFIPFLAEKKVIIVAVGVMALDILLIVLLSSLYMRYLKQKLWRILHYGSYLFFCLGFWHGLSISDRFELNAEVNFLAPKKVILELEVAVLLMVVGWRIILHQNRRKSV